MQSIGERLEEARKKKGISVREAAEAIKVNGNFLDCFENDNFDIGIPDIYVRGFLKSYSKFLHIDPARIATDYNSFKMGRSKISKRDRGDLLGRLDLPEAGASAEEEPQQAPQQDEANALRGFSSSGTHRSRFAEAAGSLDTGSEVDYSMYWKLGLAIVTGFAVIGLLIYIIWNVITKPGPDLNPELDDTAEVEVSGAQILQPTEEKIRLLASGDVDVLVVEKETNKRLYRGPLAAGEEVEIVTSGPVTIAFSEGRHLGYEKDGQRYNPGTDGLGRITVP